MDQVTAATEALRDRIFDGSLSADTPLRQQALAAEFGVSATPIREAFRRLEALGLINFDPRRGVRVAPIDKAEVETALLIRARLEPLALELAERPFDLERLTKLAAKCRSASSPKSTFAANAEFHAALASHTDQRFIREILEKASLISGRAILHWMNRLPALEGFDDEHLAIIEHLRSGDIGLAAGTLQAHILKAHDQIRSLTL